VRVKASTFALATAPDWLRATFVLATPPDWLRATFVLATPPDWLRANVPNVHGDGGVFEASSHAKDCRSRPDSDR
jgi:hypothetical protein